jgi:hypothetical protein
MVTQQFFKPFGYIPKGWKTIVEISFDAPSLELVKSIMPIKDSWGTNAYIMFEKNDKQA